MGLDVELLEQLGICGEGGTAAVLGALRAPATAAGPVRDLGLPGVPFQAAPPDAAVGAGADLAWVKAFVALVIPLVEQVGTAVQETRATDGYVAGALRAADPLAAREDGGPPGVACRAEPVRDPVRPCPDAAQVRRVEGGVPLGSDVRTYLHKEKAHFRHDTNAMRRH